MRSIRKGRNKIDYQEDIQKAILICKAEKLMRETVFKHDFRQKQVKTEQMDYCIKLLQNYKKTLESRTGNLFGT